MLLSVLIPTYNYDCTKLVRDLSGQLPSDCEIIVADDCSTETLISLALEEIDKIPHATLWRASQNMGRSAIRNKLAAMAEGEWLLFMDSDAEVPDSKFISRYMENLTADVVVGGTSAPDRCPSPEVSLRYEYERRFWLRATPEQRSKKPYDSFTAFNFMIRRSAFEETRFDEHSHEYGHEDTLLGIMLKEHHKSILHIVNPLIHNGLEPNNIYMEKVEKSLLALRQNEGKLQTSSTMLKAYTKVERLHLVPLIRLWHKIFGLPLRRNLCSTHPRLYLFNIYKLGYYSSITNYKL